MSKPADAKSKLYPRGKPSIPFRTMEWSIGFAASAFVLAAWIGSGAATALMLLCGLYATLRGNGRQRRLHADRTREQNAHATAILESISDAFLAFDRDWRVIYINHEAERLIETTRDLALGNNIWEMFPHARDSDFDVEYHRVMEERVARHFETYYAPQKRWYEVRVYPSAQGITAYFRDISERVASEERFRVLFEQSSDAHLLVGEGGLIDCNQATVAMWGCADKSQVLALHPAVLSPPRQPDGRDSHDKAMEMDKLARARGGHRFEWTHRKMDGTDFPVEVTLTPVTLANKPVILAALHDLTERKRAEARAHAQYSVTRTLSEADSLETACRPILQAVCQGMDWNWGAIWRVDAGTNALRCADAWYPPECPAGDLLKDTMDMTFTPGTGLPGRVWAACEPEWIEDVTQADTFVRANVARRNDLHAGVAFPIYFDGKVVGVMELLSREVRSEDAEQMLQLNALGSQIGQFMKRRQAEQQMQTTNERLAEANAHLAGLANTDGLTGLNNHRVFQERLAAEFERSARHQSPLSLLLLDVDKFKQYNDAFGHPAGDQVLKQVGEILQAATRGEDVAARYGGEEFVILLPETEARGALRMAERVRETIAAAPWTERAITVSVGAATLALSTPTQAALIEQADRALYASKSAGRNRVTHHNALLNLAGG